jgi:hypothetical protein
MYYGIQIAKPKDGQDPNRLPTSEELCSAYSSKLIIFVINKNKKLYFKLKIFNF